MIRLRPRGREGPDAARRTEVGTGCRDLYAGGAEAGLGAGPEVGTGRRGGHGGPPVQDLYIRLHLIEPSRDEQGLDLR